MSILIAFIALSALVIIHELGHYLAARAVGVRVTEFGLGFPPRLFSLKTKNTRWSLNLILFGGFVTLKGEQEDGTDAHAPDGYRAAKTWKKIVILSGGVVANMLAALVLLWSLYVAGVYMPVDQSRAENIDAYSVGSVQPDSPAARAGLKAGDLIIAFGERSLKSISLNEYKASERDITVRVRRSTGETDISIQRETVDQTIGVYYTAIAKSSLPLMHAFMESVQTTAWLTLQTLQGLISFLISLFSFTPTADVSGVIGIAGYANQSAQLGVQTFLQFIAILSINLAVFNILPLPVLDGGRIVLVLIQKIFPKLLTKKREELILQVSVALVLLLMIYATVKDVQRIIN